MCSLVDSLDRPQANYCPALEQLEQLNAVLGRSWKIWAIKMPTVLSCSQLTGWLLAANIKLGG